MQQLQVNKKKMFVHEENKQGYITTKNNIPKAQNNLIEKAKILNSIK